MSRVDYNGSSQAQYDHDGGTSDLTLTGVELGVHYWAWPKSTSSSAASLGFFVGPNLAYAGGTFQTQTLHYGKASESLRSAGISQFTVSVDAGLALFVRPLVLGVGFGMQYTASNVEPKSTCSGFCLVDGMQLFHGGGIRPRILASAGIAF